MSENSISSDGAANRSARIFAQSSDDEICITGIAGKFPNSKNVAEFEYNLYNKIDMVDESSRWPNYHAEVPKRMGNISDVDRFDAQFFGVNHKQAQTLDPQGRQLQERAYEAIIDAGINPKTLRGSRTGVFIGSCFAESEKTWFYDHLSERGFGITGCSRAMLSNRISYSLGLHGPSFLVDTACSSSMYALDVAFSAIRSGECDAAIVGGSNLLLHPNTSIQFARLGVLAQDGICRPFDKDACGYVRAEAICTIFLQKSKVAKRVYAKVIYSKTNCDGYKMEGITYPSGQMQQRLLSEFYADIDISPNSVGYVEAHSTGTVVGDPEECQALDNIFCQNRDGPLLVGSVKSNIGHSESTSGACSIAKVILAFERGQISPNINFTEIKEEIKSLKEKRLVVCTEVTDLPLGSLVGINSFGFGGANAHALLAGNVKVKVNAGSPIDNVPRLVTWSGRTEESISCLFDFLKQQSLDAEYIGMLQNVQSVEEPAFIYRGYGLFGKAESSGGNAVCLGSGTERFDGSHRPLVWMFSGMGSQWPEMGKSLLCIEIFRKSIEKSHRLLESYGVDVLEIITQADPSIFDNIVHSFVGIAAIQIAIVDILTELDLQPDYLIGHSVGELGCGYADGALTAEQMLLSAYYRGLASLRAKLIRGGMAAIGMGHRQIVGLLPADIEVACHNSADSCTISGPEASVQEFVAALSGRQVFARAVNCSHIAYHSRYVTDVGELMLTLTKDLCPIVRRSSRWLSTSVPQKHWQNEDCEMSCPQYYINNLLNSVLFEETAAMLPANAIVVEIAPHGLLQAIVKRSMPKAVHIPLTYRGNSNNAAFLLTGLGKLYLNGITMPLERIYPAIQYPVSRGTAKISPLIRWDHSDSYYVTKFEVDRAKMSGERRVKINLGKEEYAYIAGHRIDGRCLFPATGYLELVWATFAQMRGAVHYMMDVEFENIHFHRATALNADVDVELTTMIHYGNGSFEVSEGTTSIVTGRIFAVEKPTALTKLPTAPPSAYPLLHQEDFYKELRIRGYHYSNAFQSVRSASSEGHFGHIAWDQNWVSFMDCILQIVILSKDTRSLLLPTRIQQLRINPSDHMAQFEQLDPENPYFEVHLNADLGIIQSGGVEFVGLVANSVTRRKPPGDLVLESYQFIPHFPAPMMSMEDALRVCGQLVVENLQMVTIRATEVHSSEVPIIGMLDEVFSELPMVATRLTLLSRKPEFEIHNVTVQNAELSSQENCSLLIVTTFSADATVLAAVSKCLVAEGYVLAREKLQRSSYVPPGFCAIVEIPTESETLVLWRRSAVISMVSNIVKISSEDTNFDWLTAVQQSIKVQPLLLVADKDKFSGVMGLVNCMRREPDAKNITCVFIDDLNAPDFDLNHPLYSDQLMLNLALNVYRNGTWGSYRHLKLQQEKENVGLSDHYYANVMQNGDLSSFAWLQGPLDERKHSKLVRVQYSSINFRDVMLATGRLSAEMFALSRLHKECVLGLEYAGINGQGQRLMGMVAAGSMASLVQPYWPLTWLVPEQWSLQEAATVPVVYVTVYCAFFLGRPITPGKSILIHAGSGGVGLAAIRIAFAYGMEVYTTVSTDKKKKYILGLFPQLKEFQIASSRDCSFEHMIKEQTHGKGVDFVLNSLSDEKLQASVRCLGRGGVFLEIGKFDLSNDTKIGLGVFLKEMTFRSVLADNLFLMDGPNETKYIHGLIERDLRAGIIRPLCSTVFQVNEIEKAYRYLISGQHIGKILIRVRDRSTDELTVPISSLPRAYFSDQNTYVIAGGLGGFGLELADWMVLRGARKLVLSSRKGFTTQYQEFRTRLWQSYGCQVEVCTADITTLRGCRALIDVANAIGPIDGIFNLAVQLRDGLMENLTADNFLECMAPKACATQHLDYISRHICPNLRYFVVFSSVSCGRGNAGQANYGLANSMMERIIENRVRMGFSGKAIQWGAIGDVGLAAALLSANEDAEISGTHLQRISSCLHELDTLLTTRDPIVASMMVARKRNASGKRSATLMQSVLNIMSIKSMKSIPMTTSLSDLGMDSLMAIEIKQTLEREFEIYLPTQELRALTFLTLQKLSDDAVKQQGNDSSVAGKLNEELREFDLTGLLAEISQETSPRIYRLPSKDCSDNFDKHVLIMPGVEGDNRPIWRAIAQNIQLPTYIVGYHNTFEASSGILEMAKYFANDFQETFKTPSKFYLVGYSFGVLVTIEIARILEKMGMTGHIISIDGGPIFLKKFMHTVTKTEDLTDKEIQLYVACAVLQAVFPDENDKERQEKMSKYESWSDKLDALIQLAEAAGIVINETFLRNFATGLYMRTIAAQQYSSETQPKIRSPITLVRAKTEAVSDIDEKYGLADCTEASVTVQFIDGNHQTLLENSKLIQIINELHG